MRRAWQRLTLRARLLLIGVLGVATALAIGSVTLYAVLSYAGYRTLDESGTATAAEVAMLVDRGQLPDPIPVTGSQMVQVVDGRNRVVSASVNGDRLTSLLLPAEVRRALAGSPVQVPGSRAGLDSPVRVVAVRAHPPNRSRVVLVSQQFDDITHSQHVLKITLLATYPLLLGVLWLIAWRVVGATLRPVEALRSSAEQISGSGQDGRLPVPASDDEIHALAVTLNSMLDRLAESRSRQRSFVADAAHELRSPLTSMQTQLEVSQRLGDDLPGTDDLHTEVRRMAALVEDLLVLARLDTDETPRRSPARVQVAALLRDVSGAHARSRVPVTLTDLGDVEEATVHGDEDELRRVLVNLVDNATRHASTGVELSARRDEGHVVVEVADDGPGIPAAERERAFERFARLDRARDRDTGGSGLGLSIVRELLTRNGGDIVLGDSASGGLRARVRFQLAPHHDQQAVAVG